MAEALALLGVRPVWHPHSGRVEGLEVMTLERAGPAPGRRHRPHLGLLPRRLPRRRRPPRRRRRAGRRPATTSRRRRTPSGPPAPTTPACSGPGPGSYGSGIWQAIENRSWRTRSDLAEVYLAWSGFAYRRDGVRRRRPRPGAAPVRRHRRRRQEPGQPRARHLRRRRLLPGPRRHGGGGGRAVRAGSRGRGSATRPTPPGPKVRSLAEEAARVVRTRVLNPKWLAAMRRHGYKGAFEVAATVDYLFGYDATAGVVEDWMYERVTQAYVGDPEMREFYERSNPWALRSICERLLEANERDLWSASARRPRHPARRPAGGRGQRGAPDVSDLDAHPQRTGDAQPRAGTADRHQFGRAGVPDHRPSSGPTTPSWRWPWPPSTAPSAGCCCGATRGRPSRRWPGGWPPSSPAAGRSWSCPSAPPRSGWSAPSTCGRR